jgi:Ca2+-binding EF-hand superfamily protein
MRWSSVTGERGEARRVLATDQRLFEEEFQALDANNDGVVDESDFVDLAERVCRRFGIPRGSVAAARLREALRSSARNLLREADSGRDGDVTHKEFVGTLRNQADRGDAGFERNKPIAEAIWEIMDNDRDGTVSREEFRRVERAFGISDEIIEAACQQIDRDRDDVLHRDEVVNFLASWGNRA